MHEDRLLFFSILVPGRLESRLGKGTTVNIECYARIS